MAKRHCVPQVEQMQQCLVMVMLIMITCDYLCHVTYSDVWRQGIRCTVLTLCDGQLAVPASNCALCGYVLK